MKVPNNVPNQPLATLSRATVVVHLAAGPPGHRKEKKKKRRGRCSFSRGCSGRQGECEGRWGRGKKGGRGTFCLDCIWCWVRPDHLALELSWQTDLTQSIQPPQHCINKLYTCTLIKLLSYMFYLFSRDIYLVSSALHSPFSVYI